MNEQEYYPPQVLALATEALRVAKTSNCTLFAIPDPDSEWGFVPESFLGSADWMFSADRIFESRISMHVIYLAKLIKEISRVNISSATATSLNYMKRCNEKIVLFELIGHLCIIFPELDDAIKFEANKLEFEDFL